MPEPPIPSQGFLLAHYTVSADVERSRRFHTDALGGQAVLGGGPLTIALSNTSITQVGQVTGRAERRPSTP